jgi:hypothetical protein
MSVQAAICELLAASEAVTGLVGKRIRPQKVTGLDDRPFIAVRANETPWTTLEQTVATAGSAVASVIVVSDDEAEANQIVRAVKDAVIEFNGTAGGLRFPGRWEEDVDPDMSMIPDGGDSHNWHMANVGFGLHWEAAS